MKFFLVRRYWHFLALVAMFLASAAPAAAASPRIQFDVGRVVACRDVTTPEFALQNPGEKLIAVPLSVSCLLPPGSESDLYQLLYRVRTRAASELVVDYLPRTTMAPTMTGNIGVQSQDQQRKSLAFHAKAQYPFFAQGEAAGAMHAESYSTQNFELLPPLELLAASGTTDRGSGVFFKLLPSNRTALEGGKDFLVVLRVPLEWRADYLLVTCQGCRTLRDVPLIAEDRMQCGGVTFLVAVHLEGDAEARTAATRFTEAETRLRATVNAKRDAMRQRQYPTPFHEVASLWDAKSGKTVESWLEQILLDEVPAASLAKQIPADVLQAAKAYRVARARLLASSADPSWPTTALVRRLPRSS